MKGISKTKLVLIIIAFIITANIFPYVVRKTLAAGASDVITEIKLVKTNDDKTYAAVNEGELMNQRNKYYVQLDWEGNAVIPNEEYTVKATGLLFEDSADEYDIFLTDKDNKPLGYPAIGTIYVLGNEIKIQFNENIASEEISSLGPLSGDFLVRASVDINNFQLQENFTVGFYLNNEEMSKLNLRHEMIVTDFSSMFRNATKDASFEKTLVDMIPGETFEVKVNIVPQKGYTIEKFNIYYIFNDYSLDFFEGTNADGAGIGRIDPSLNGETITDYEFIRNPAGKNGERRPEGMKEDLAAQLDVESEWGFLPNSMPELSEAGDFNYFFSINGEYTGNNFMNYDYKIKTQLDPIYKVEKYDEIIINAPTEAEVELTDVIVKYIGYNENGEAFEGLLPDKVYNDVPVNSTDYFNYVVPTRDSDTIHDRGYYVARIDNLKTLSPNKGENIIYVHCFMCCTEGYADVVVKFLREGTNVAVLNDKYFKNISINTQEFYNYQVEEADREALDDLGYKVTRVISAPKPLKANAINYVYVYVDLEGGGPTTTPTSSTTPTTKTTGTTTGTAGTTTPTNSGGGSTPTTSRRPSTSRTPSTRTTTRRTTRTPSTRSNDSSTSRSPGTMTATYETTRRTTSTTATKTTTNTATWSTTPISSYPPITSQPPDTATDSWVPETDIPSDSVPWDNPSPGDDTPPPTNGGDPQPSTRGPEDNPQTFDNKVAPMFLILILAAVLIVADKLKIFSR
ncbi:MAG: hypothetical protein LBV08_02090 [Clostridiales bacterium]|jgi:hypothetical protein|nr:hypothetical protein [Clostridiales bacterium]